MSVLTRPPIVTNGLVLHLDAANRKSYPGTGTTWFDMSGNNNSGSLVNGPVWSQQQGGTITFDGTNDYAITPFYSAITTPSTPHSMMAWINTTALTGTYGIVNIGEWADNEWATGIVLVNRVFYWSINGSNTGFVVPYGAVSSGYTVNTNTWYHLAFSKSTTNISTYVNGTLTLSAANTATGIVYPSPVMIGVGSQGSTRSGFFSGKISTTSLYNRALSAQEVLQNYNATKARFGL